jgi:hypothetical protein
MCLRCLFSPVLYTWTVHDNVADLYKHRTVTVKEPTAEKTSRKPPGAARGSMTTLPGPSRKSLKNMDAIRLAQEMRYALFNTARTPKPYPSFSEK